MITIPDVACPECGSTSQVKINDILVDLGGTFEVSPPEKPKPKSGASTWYEIPPREGMRLTLKPQKEEGFAQLASMVWDLDCGACSRNFALVLTYDKGTLHAWVDMSSS